MKCRGKVYTVKDIQGACRRSQKRYARRAERREAAALIAAQLSDSGDRPDPGLPSDDIEAVYWLSRRPLLGHCRFTILSATQNRVKNR